MEVGRFFFFFLRSRRKGRMHLKVSESSLWPKVWPTVGQRLQLDSERQQKNVREQVMHRDWRCSCQSHTPQMKNLTSSCFTPKLKGKRNIIPCILEMKPLFWMSLIGDIFMWIKGIVHPKNRQYALNGYIFFRIIQSFELGGKCA